MLTNDAKRALHNMAGENIASNTASMADSLAHVASWWWHHVHVRVLFSVLLKHPARYYNA